jgi:hypothetical protein
VAATLTKPYNGVANRLAFTSYRTYPSHSHFLRIANGDRVGLPIFRDCFDNVDARASVGSTAQSLPNALLGISYRFVCSSASSNDLGGTFDRAFQEQKTTTTDECLGIRLLEEGRRPQFDGSILAGRVSAKALVV